jgi:protein-S-isoprenylcysteine O-methyltransferase Ste14
VTQSEKSIRTGEWLFRWRSYLPLVLLVLIIPALMDYSYPFGSHAWKLAWELFSFMTAMFGLAVRAYTIGYTPKNTSGRNVIKQVADSLNTTGIYSILRNPLYFGNFFMTLGVIMSIRHGWLCLVYSLVFWLYYERIIMAEETFLSGKFGKEFDDYRARTPAFIPDIRLWRPPVLPFSFRNVLKREYSGFFGIIAAFTVMDCIGGFIVEGRFVIDPVWAVLFLFGLVVYLTLLTLKKKTRVLHVEGR